MTRPFNTWRIANPSGEAEDGLNWDNREIANQITERRVQIYALQEIHINTSVN